MSETKSPTSPTTSKLNANGVERFYSFFFSIERKGKWKMLNVVTINVYFNWLTKVDALQKINSV